jgi:hypothetical protein
MSMYELRVRLKDIQPPVWRDVRVPADITLNRLHEVLQVAMGWTNSHLYLFHAGGVDYAEMNEEWPKVQDSAVITLKDIVTRVGQSFEYEYDMGDRWVHELTVTGPVDTGGEEGPRCTGGARACPPEDSGGPSRYQEILEAISDPRNEEHDELLAWVGEDFDPEKFDARSADSALEQMR